MRSSFCYGRGIRSREALRPRAITPAKNIFNQVRLLLFSSSSSDNCAVQGLDASQSQFDGVLSSLKDGKFDAKSVDLRWMSHSWGAKPPSPVPPVPVRRGLLPPGSPLKRWRKGVQCGSHVATPHRLSRLKQPSTIHMAAYESSNAWRTAFPGSRHSWSRVPEPQRAASCTGGVERWSGVGHKVLTQPDRPSALHKVIGFGRTSSVHTNSFGGDSPSHSPSKTPAGVILQRPKTGVEPMPANVSAGRHSVI